MGLLFIRGLLMDSPTASNKQIGQPGEGTLQGLSVDWMNALKERDETAFLSLYREFSGQVLAICLRVLNDRHIAEDVLSEVFWEIWRQPQRYDSSRGTPQTYLLMLARSRAIDRLREMSRRAKVLNEARDRIPALCLTQGDETPSTNVNRQEEWQVLRTALESLDAKQRQVLELAFFGGMSHQQIASRLDHPLGTVKSRIRQGLMHLRAKLSPSFAERYRP